VASTPELDEPEELEDPEPLDVESPSSAEVRLSCAEVRLSSASWSVSSAELGSSVAISWPFLTCSPTVTSTVLSVPLVAKFTASSTPGSTLPLPETVVCTTPSSAVTTSFEVRAELAGAPTSLTPRAMIAIATIPSRYRYHGRDDRRPRRRVIFQASG
jgi:hypothetical protein